MRHATALSVKLAVYLVIFGVSMPIFGLTALPRSMILAAFHTLVLWLADLIVLPRFGNMVATLTDFALLVLGSFLVLGAMMAVPNPMGLLMAILLSTAFEWWFHRWLRSFAIVE
ncbi:MAG: hypothetical protein JWN15_1528 [Firmicutes bacterium]|nr:hypothetical protein [Bacillota bacterium]